MTFSPMSWTVKVIILYLLRSNIFCICNISKEAFFFVKTGLITSTPSKPSTCTDLATIHSLPVSPIGCAGMNHVDENLGVSSTCLQSDPIFHNR